MAESLRENGAGHLGADHLRAGSTPHPGPRAVLVHAVSIEADVPESSAAFSAPPERTPIIVLLDDAPRVPDFLPVNDDLDLAAPTEEQIRRAIERRVREGLDQPFGEHSLLDVLGSIQDAVMVIDRNRILTYLNPCAVSLLQTLTRRTGPFLGEPLATAFPPAASPTIGPAIHDALAHADARRVDDPERHRGLALDVSVFPNPYGATLVVRDATKRKDIEAELVETRVALSRAEARLRARDDEARA